MAGLNQSRRIAIVTLNESSIATARKIQARYADACIYGSRKRVASAEMFYDDFGATLQDLYRNDTAIIALCAAGIAIRSLAPLLALKGAEPPVLAVAEDGSAVVPLLGGLGGVNAMAREIGAALNVPAAITTSGELRFGTCLLNPPAGYALADIEQGKRFVSDLLSGQRVRIEGEARWLDGADLPLDDSARHVIRISADAGPEGDDELLIHPRTVVAIVDNAADAVSARVREALAEAGFAAQSLACLVAPVADMASLPLQRAARQLAVPLRFVADTGALPWPRPPVAVAGIALCLADQPLDPQSIGQARGSLTVVGLGPGAQEFMAPAARMALARAEDILGYETYVNMAGPFRADQVLHCTDNREEMQRARHAFALAARGRRAVVVSSGDPGVFAMAAAVLEALHESTDPLWHAVDLEILPGISAAFATAARVGAPLGHDFCVMSLSDNLKPWDIIEQRLEHAAAADFALAFYNPISRARPWQLGRALDIVARHRDAATVVVLGRDIGRPAEAVTITTLAQLRPDQVDMRTMVIIGSSTTCRFGGPASGQGETSVRDWVYTPRWYGR